MSTLPTPLRRQLESTVTKAREIAKGGATKALKALAVHETDPYGHMDEAQRDLRRKLRAQARQLGDGESTTKRGAYEIKHLVEKLAYDQWHRLLFARFLLENNLLISPEHGVSVSLDDCEELAPSLGLKDAWAVAARFAAKELPEIFRADDPAGAVEFAVEDRKPLIQFVTGLPSEVFTASDSLGWCYQFWQAAEKETVNKSGNKIGADELPAVTQLFTEDYMVDFLLDNTLGAWRAGKVLAAKPKIAETAQSEEELRNAVALPGCPWKYLRFIKAETGGWRPAAGTFDGWPKTAKELTCIDPCMGSGHFVVAMFERVVALRVAEERMGEATAVAAVIRDNLFGLEIDPRCTQIGAFNLALAAWRRVGHCTLPPMNLACSGLAPNAKKEDWLKLAGENEKLQNGTEQLYQLFKDAPVLGSLINPRTAGGNLLVAGFQELQPLLEKALEQETKDATAHEMAVTARGVAKAAEILSSQFTLVATNVPYLGQKKHGDVLKEHIEENHEEGKADLATAFILRCLYLCAQNGTASLVTPQNWLFLGAYKKLRRRLLRDMQWGCVARLGARAFETISGEVVNVTLIVLTRQVPSGDQSFAGLDASDEATAMDKATALSAKSVGAVGQCRQLRNPDAKLSFAESIKVSLLADYASAPRGVVSGDRDYWVRAFWEFVTLLEEWQPLQSAVSSTTPFGARETVIDWRTNGEGMLRPGLGNTSYRKRGVAISQVGDLSCTLYTGELYDNSVFAIVANDAKDLAPVWAFCSSSAYNESVRQFNQKLTSVRTLVEQIQLVNQNSRVLIGESPVK